MKATTDYSDYSGDYSDYSDEDHHETEHYVDEESHYSGEDHHETDHHDGEGESIHSHIDMACHSRNTEEWMGLNFISNSEEAKYLIGLMVLKHVDWNKNHGVDGEEIHDLAEGIFY